MESIPLFPRLAAMESIDLSSLKKRLNADLSSAKRFLRWNWLRLSRRRFQARNVEGAPPGLKADFASMLEDEDGADMTFVVGDRQFRAYRRVLTAGSPVLGAELLREQTSAELVKIDDMEPATFEALLHYTSTGALPDNIDDGNAALQRLLVAADRYGMHNLMAMCEWKLCKSIDVQTVATTLAWAEQHHRAKLKDACIRFESSKSVKVAGMVNRWRTTATSLFRRARASQACMDACSNLLFMSCVGLFVYVAFKSVASEMEESMLGELRENQSSMSRISCLCRLALFEERLQHIQESAWLNSDI